MLQREWPLMFSSVSFRWFKCSWCRHFLLGPDWPYQELGYSLNFQHIFSYHSHPITRHVLLLYSSYHMVSGGTCRHSYGVWLGTKPSSTIILGEERKKERAHVPNNTALTSFSITTDEPSVSSNSRSLHSTSLFKFFKLM